MVEELRVPITVVVSLSPLPQAAGSTLQVERVTIAPSLPTDHPLLHHIALVLQAAIEGESVAGQLSAQLLADALVTPFPASLTTWRVGRHKKCTANRDGQTGKS